MGTFKMLADESLNGSRAVFGIDRYKYHNSIGKSVDTIP